MTLGLLPDSADGSSPIRLVEVAVDAAGAGGSRTYTYAVPERLADLVPGEAVLALVRHYRSTQEKRWLDALFARNGSWVVRPQAWDDPDQSLERQEFFQVLEACLQAVPGVAGRVFILREVMDLEPDEICKDLEISKSNYWVLMHRARLRLRGCLDNNWFAGLRRS